MYMWGSSIYPYGVGGVAPQSYATGMLAPQGVIGSILGGLLGGAGGEAIGGLFGSGGRDIGNSIGSLVGSVGGGFLPFSAGPRLSVAGGDPTETTTQTGPKSILLPQSAVPPEVATILGIQNSVAKGAADGAIGRVVQYLQGNEGTIPKAREEITTLATRALDFVDAGDYQSALVQAYLANYTLDAAIARAAQKGQNSSSG